MSRGRLGGLVTVVLAVAASAVGCGEEGRGDLVIAGKPPATPYSGPLRVPYKELDEDSLEDTKASSGAAGLALKCEGEIYSGGFSEPWRKGDGGATPEEGLKTYFASDYEGKATMPGDARGTGYRLDDWELWLTADAAKAYIRTSQGVETWPAVKENVGCR